MSAGWCERRLVPLPKGGAMACLELGPVDGPAVVFLHGLTNSAEAWLPTMAALHAIDSTRHLVAVDLRGHGRTQIPVQPGCADDPSSCFSMAALARDVLAFLDAQGLEGVALVGHSMGSLVAQDLALAAPQRVSDLVLVSTTSDATATPILGDWLLEEVLLGGWRQALQARGVRWPDQALALTPLDVDPGMVDWLQQYWNVYPITPERSTRLLARQTAEVPLLTWLGATQGVLAHSRTQALQHLQVPTLVLWGTQDAFFRAADQRTLVDALIRAHGSGGRFAWKQYGRRPLAESGLQTDDLGHNLPWEVPGEVAADIAAFVSTGRPRGTGVRTDAPEQPTRLVTESATIVSRP